MIIKVNINNKIINVNNIIQSKLYLRFWSRLALAGGR
jgi:hypothetical protein